MKTHKKAKVILAAFNGERHIKEQLSSILSCEYPGQLRVQIYLDRSSDSTESEIQLFGDKVELQKNPIPSGSAKANFLNALQSLDCENDTYYFLSDQDDVWNTKKVLKTANMLARMEQKHGEDTPCLVFSDSEVTDSKLEPISKSYFSYENINPDIFRTPESLFFQNAAQGCTFGFNSALKRKLSRQLDTEKIKMHDHWILLAAAYTGKVSYINEPLLQYRQHEKNEVGSRKYSPINLAVRSIRNLKKTKASVDQSWLQANYFFETYGAELKPEFGKIKSALTKSYSNRTLRKRFIAKHVRTSSKIKTLGLILLS